VKFLSGKFLMVGLGTGIAAGILAGLVGIGGGVLIVPSLVYFAGFNHKMAQGTRWQCCCRPAVHSPSGSITGQETLT